MGEAIAGVEFKLGVFEPIAGQEVVGKDAVRTRRRILQHPDGLSVRPDASRVLVVGIEFLQVAGHVPVEVGLGGHRHRRCATAASSATR